MQCQYPELRRLDASRSKPPSTAGSLAATATADPLIPPTAEPQLAGIDHTLPEIKGYLAYKGYDQDPEQATAVALMSALLRDTQVAKYFLGREEPWVLLRDLVNDEAELRCVCSVPSEFRVTLIVVACRYQISHAINYTLSLLVIDERNNFWLDIILYILLVKKPVLPETVAALKLVLLQLGAAHVA